MDAPSQELQKYWYARESYRVSGEPRLADFCLLILRRKWIFLVTVGTGLAIGIVVGFTQPTFYESRAVVEIGQLGFNRPFFEPTESVVERLREVYRVGERSDGSVNPPFLSDVRISKQAKNFIILTAAGPEPERARDFLQSVLGRLFTEHEALREQALLASRMQIDLLEKQIDRFRSDVQALERRVQQAMRKGMATGAMTLSLDKNRLIEQQAELEQQRIRIRAEIAEGESKPTRAIRDPSLPSTTAGSRPSLYAFIGLVAGLAAGILAVLIFEFVLVVRQKQALLKQ
ncbi:hypothetical protein [Sulfurifustis variabilis]|uniref:hypothetical protein n=1 Tax=Sulfurifustis variabilis TaxID=1675686 RepID=UPI000BBB6348|nr:hypothetical protein [Sulfurifustis variabilis]